MAKGKSKNRNNNNRSANQSAATPKPEQKAEVTVETVVASTTENEFEKNKDALITKFLEEIDQLDKDRDAAKQSAEEAKKLSDELETEFTALSAKR